MAEVRPSSYLDSAGVLEEYASLFQMDDGRPNFRPCTANGTCNFLHSMQPKGGNYYEKGAFFNPLTRKG